MPFTPFHGGPGLFVKGAAPRSFSFFTFAAAQVVIDCETAYHMIRHEYPVHRQLHTFLGATIAGSATAVVFLAVRRIAAPWIGLAAQRLPFLRSESSATAILWGGLIGGASHPLFDGLMHRDVRPFSPWSQANPLLGHVSVGAIHLGCVTAAIVGMLLLLKRS